MNVVGLDLSLTHTGVADGFTGPWVIVPKKLRGIERVDFIANLILINMDERTDLICIEGYSFGSRSSQAHALGELGGVVRRDLWREGFTYIDIPPSTLKTYATGKGNAGKLEVVANARERLGYGGFDDNCADALWLRALGLDLLGEPLVSLPQTHRRALDKMEVPK